MSYDRSYDSFVKPSPAFVHDFGLRIIKTRTLRKLQFKCSLLRILSRLNNTKVTTIYRYFGRNNGLSNTNKNY